MEGCPRSGPWGADEADLSVYLRSHGVVRKASVSKDTATVISRVRLGRADASRSGADRGSSVRENVSRVRRMKQAVEGLLNGVLLSVRPQYSRALLDGTKQVELRRRAFRSGPGSVIALYEAAPTMALSGFLVVRRVYEGSPEAMWSHIGNRTLLSRCEFLSYLLGRREAFAI